MGNGKFRQRAELFTIGVASASLLIETQQPHIHQDAQIYRSGLIGMQSVVTSTSTTTGTAFGTGTT